MKLHCKVTGARALGVLSIDGCNMTAVSLECKPVSQIRGASAHNSYIMYLICIIIIDFLTATTSISNSGSSLNENVRTERILLETVLVDLE